MSQEEDGKNRNSVFILTSNLTDGVLDISGYKERYVILQFFDDDKTHFKINANGGVGETNTEYGVLSITGIKFGSGSSSSGGDSTESSQKILAIDTLYSEEEKIVGSWINGKPIYQLTFSIDVPSPHTDFLIHSIPDNLDRIIDLRANLYSYDNGWLTQFFAYYDPERGYFHIYKNKNGIFAYCFEDCNVQCTILYTKTTDEENSFTYDMIDSTENLTDEQIVALASESIAAAWPQ